MYIAYQPFKPLEQENKVKENQTTRCVDEKRRCSSCCLDISNVNMWLVNYLATIENENCWIDTNKARTISTWYPRGLLVVLVVLVQEQALRTKHSASIRFKSLENNGFIVKFCMSLQQLANNVGVVHQCSSLVHVYKTSEFTPFQLVPIY